MGEPHISCDSHFIYKRGKKRCFHLSYKNLGHLLGKFSGHGKLLLNPRTSQPYSIEKE